MFTYRQLLILTVTILSAKIIFADILVPNYKLQYNDNPFYQRSQPTITIPNKVPVQYAKQIMVQPSEQYPLGVQTMHLPNYEAHQDQARSNLQLLGYPHYSKYQHYHPYNHRRLFTKPTGNLHYVKLGSREYVRPSIFVSHSNPLAAHYRRKRSTDLTSTSDKSAVADVATKSTLIDTKHPPAIDSLLPENKSTNTNDKHVKNRRRDTDFATKSFLFGLDPNKMLSELKGKNLDKTEDETQHSLSKRHGATLISPVVLTQKFTPESVKTTTTEPAQQMLSTHDKGQNQEASSTNYENPRPTPSVPSTTNNLEQPSNPITISQMQSSEEESHESSKYHNYDTYKMPLSYEYWIWPNYMSNAEMQPSNSKKSYQENVFNYLMQQPLDQASSQKTTNVGAINTIQPITQEKSSKSVTTSVPSTFYDPYTFSSYYPSNYINNYEDNDIDTDDEYYDDDYDYDEDDYNDKSTYLTDGFYAYANKNFVYSRNAQSNKFYDNYANAQSNAPVTYVVSTSPDVEPYTYTYYYPRTKTYVPYKPFYDCNYYYYNKNYPNYQNVQNVCRAIPPTVSYYYYYY